MPTGRTQNPDSSNEDDGSVRATMGEIGYLSLSAMAESRDRTGEFTRHLSMENMVIVATDANGIHSSGSTFYQVQSPKFPGLHSIMAAYPIQRITREATSIYIHRFIDEIGISLPCFDREEILQDFETTIPDYGIDITTGDSDGSLLRHFSTFMVLAIGALISPESNRIESFVVSLHAAAMKLFPAILKTDEDGATIRCMLLMVLYSIYSPQGGSTWHLTGLTTKKCIASRFHKEPDAHTSLTLSEIKDRRRVFWSLYILDR